MSSRVSMFTADGYSSREVDYQRSTPLDLHVQVDGASATITSATCSIKLPGSTLSHALTVVNNATGLAISSLAPATETIKVTVAPSDLTALNIQLWQQFDVVWVVTFTLDSDSVTRQWPEVVEASDQILEPALNISRITGAYAELRRTDSLAGTGQTTWWWKAQEAWAEIRNLSILWGPDRRLILLRNRQVLSDLHYHWTLMKICDLQAQRLEGDWIDRLEIHTAECKRLQSQIIGIYADQSPVLSTQNPTSDAKTMRAPHNLTGRGSMQSWGGF